jgi:hypothetical protein
MAPNGVAASLRMKLLSSACARDSPTRCVVEPLRYSDKPVCQLAPKGPTGPDRQHDQAFLFGFTHKLSKAVLREAV